MNSERTQPFLQVLERPFHKKEHVSIEKYPFIDLPTQSLFDVSYILNVDSKQCEFGGATRYENRWACWIKIHDMECLSILQRFEKIVKKKTIYEPIFLDLERQQSFYRFKFNIRDDDYFRIFRQPYNENVFHPFELKEHSFQLEFRLFINYHNRMIGAQAFSLLIF